MRDIIRKILKEELLNESGIRNIKNLAKRYKKAKIYFHQDLDGVTTALAMKHYLEQNNIEVVDAEVIQYGSKEFAIKKPDASGEVMPVLVDFAHGKPMFTIHTDHHDTQAGVEKDTATSFRASRSNVETISQIVSPKEIFSAEDIKLISTVDSANFVENDITPEMIMNYLFNYNKDESLKRNKMLMGLVVNKLLLAYKNKPRFLEEIVLNAQPSLLSILNNIRKQAVEKGFATPQEMTANKERYIQSRKESGVETHGNIISQYGFGSTTKPGSYDRYTPFRNNPDADFLVTGMPMGMVQASCNPFKKDRALKGVNLGEIKDEVLNRLKPELEGVEVTFGDIKKIAEMEADYSSVGFTLKDLMAIYGNLPSFKVEGSDKLLKILDEVSNKLYRTLSDKQKALFDKIYLNGYDVIQANSGGHKCITNISGINFLYRTKKDPRLDNVPEDLMSIATYSGDDTFLKDIKEKLLKWGKLSDKQIEVALNKIERTKSETPTKSNKSYVELVKEIQKQFVETLKSYIDENETSEELTEKWSQKYKKSIDCSNPKGFSQRAHCQGRKKKDLDEYARTLKMARRQGVGTRFPKSAIKNSPSRFRKYSRDLNECVIAGVRLDDGIVLAKNRDRGYKASVEIIHELIDGVEVVYWRDVDTDWSEGMNEYGIGIVNSSLLVVEDEKEGKGVEKERKMSDKTKDKPAKKRFAADGGKIRKALSYKTLPKVVRSIVSFTGEDKKDVGLKGETIVSDNKNIYVVEMTRKHTPVIKKLKQDSKLVVRTNHGIYQKGAGYTKGEKRKSSVSRMELAKKHLEDVKTDKEVIDKLKQKYEKDPFLNPYRTKNMYHMQTTGQIMMNLEKKEVTVRMDNEMGEFKGIKNKLPKDYEPKIKIKVENEKTHLKGKKLPS
jgi:hypothetical protein